MKTYKFIMQIVLIVLLTGCAREASETVNSPTATRDIATSAQDVNNSEIFLEITLELEPPSYAKTLDLDSGDFDDGMNDDMEIIISKKGYLLARPVNEAYGIFAHTVTDLVKISLDNELENCKIVQENL